MMVKRTGRAGPSLTGSNGTFNYLIKIVTDVPETRAMYLRRLRTIMDSYLNGWVHPFTPSSVAVQCGAAVGSCTLQHLSAVCVLGSWDSCVPLQTARSTRKFDVTLSRHDCMASIPACSCSYHHLRALPLSYLRKLAWPVRALFVDRGPSTPPGQSIFQHFLWYNN